jgi:hypothetical protein
MREEPGLRRRYLEPALLCASGALRRLSVALLLACGLWLVSAGAKAQEAPETLPEDAPNVTAVEDPSPSQEQEYESIGGGPEIRAYRHTNPVKKLGIDLGLGAYTVSALMGLIYLVAVYPAQAIFGSSKVEPVMLWMLVPIAGPWMAQYEDLVKDKWVWRGLLIADAALQATGLVLGVIGAIIGDSYSAPRERSRLELHLGISGVTLTYRTL